MKNFLFFLELSRNGNTPWGQSKSITTDYSARSLADAVKLMEADFQGWDFDYVQVQGAGARHRLS